MSAELRANFRHDSIPGDIVWAHEETNELLGSIAEVIVRTNKTHLRAASLTTCTAISAWKLKHAKSSWKDSNQEENMKESLAYIDTITPQTTLAYLTRI